MKKLYTRCLLSFVIAMGFTCAATAQNVKLLNPPAYTHSLSANFIRDSAGTLFTVLNGIGYFAATTDYKHIQNLWRTDGTPAGTYMVADDITNISNIKVLNNKLYISTWGDIWLSNGTAAGSSRISSSTANFNGTDFITLHGFTYFLSGANLYKRDETTTDYVVSFGDQLINTHYSYFTPLSNSFLINIVYGDKSVTYISDGTAASTLSFDTGYNKRNITAVNDSIFFIKNGKLYTNPGAPGVGSSRVAANPAGAIVETGYTSKTIPVINNVLYFPATTPANGTELYKYDPAHAADGITLVKDIIPGSDGANIAFNTMLAAGNTLYFTVNNAGDEQLWKTDGSAEGCVLVKNLGAGTNNSVENLTAANGELYFNYTSSAYGKELWKSDGTEAGTLLVKDINPGIFNSNPLFITPAGSQTFFMANDGVHGSELWKTDGSGEGTQLVQDINTKTTAGPANIQNFVKYNGQMLFSASDDIYGTELWATDGTAAGTTLLKDIYPAITSSNPAFITAAGNGVYFITDSASAGLHQLWKTDGTAGGTVVIKRFDSYAVQPFYISGSVGNLAYFWVSNNNNKELWRTDGTNAGTFKITDLSNNVNVQTIQFSPLGNTLYFINNTDLWKSDGTAAGTIMVHHFNVMPSQMKVAKNALFIYSEQKLWVLNSGGINQVGNYNNILLVKEVNSRMFFYVISEVYDQDGYFEYNGYSLNAADTLGNVKPLADFADSPPSEFVMAGGKIYFTQTSANSLLGILNDTTGYVTYNPKNYKVVNIVNGNGKLYFEGFPAGNQYTLGYTEDDTYQGTQFVNDTIFPFQVMAPLMVINNHLLFTANLLSHSPIYPVNGYPDQLYSFEIAPEVLPVTLSSFTAKLQNGNGLLNWSTATEQNSDYFSVQRSTDGLHFSSIGKVAAAGNSTYTQNYSYTDYTLAKLGYDKLYYRLQQFDKDGKFAYSKIVPLNINTSFTASISPIPVANQLNINITSAKRQTVLIQVVDMAGKTIASFSKTAEAGSTALSYNAAGWAKGIYQVHITQANGNKQTISVVR